MSDWSKSFEPHILQRGCDYFVDGLVGETEKTEYGYRAFVYGTEKYEVRIFSDEDEISDMTCTCPYAKDGNNCKHMAAVLIALTEDGFLSIGDFKDFGETDSNRVIYLEDERDRRQSIFLDEDRYVEDAEDLVFGAEREELEEFLICELEADERMLNRFRIFMTDIVTESDLQMYKAQLTELFDMFKDSKGFVSYYMAEELEDEVQDFIDKIICDTMINYGKLDEAFLLIALIMDKFNNLEIDDSGGIMMDVLSRCRDLLSGIIAHSSDILERRIFDWADKKVAGRETEIVYEYIKSIWQESFHGAAYADRRKAVITDKIDRYMAEGEDRLSETILEGWLETYFAMTEELRVSDEELTSVIKRCWKIPAVRQYAVSRLVTDGKFHEAIVILEESRRLDRQNGSFVRSYTKQMAELYGFLGDVKNERNELIATITKYDRCDLESFRKLKRCYTEDEWPAVRQMLFNKVRNYRMAGDLYIEEKFYDKLLAHLQSWKDLWLLERYEGDVKDRYPEEILAIYEGIVRDKGRSTGQRKHYRDIVKLLRRMRHYTGGNRLVMEIVDDFKVKYKARPAMMEELEKL